MISDDLYSRYVLSANSLENKQDTRIEYPFFGKVMSVKIAIINIRMSFFWFLFQSFCNVQMTKEKEVL